MKDELFVKMATDAWKAELRATDNLFNKLSDDVLMQEIAPGRNRGIYLLGHLTTVHDMMIPLLRFGDMFFPELKPVFVDAPDRAFAEIPPAGELREKWKLTNERLAGYFSSLTPEEWFTRHANISPEDFEKEPHRNRLNVLLVRTYHLASHRGQLLYLAPKG